MTKKDYVLIASVVNDFIFTSVDNNVRLTDGHINNLIDSFVIKLEKENPRFDRAKFIDACTSITQS